MKRILKEKIKRKNQTKYLFHEDYIEGLNNYHNKSISSWSGFRQKIPSF